jgi:hypothetical protein
MNSQVKLIQVTKPLSPLQCNLIDQRLESLFKVQYMYPRIDIIENLTRQT